MPLFAIRWLEKHNTAAPLEFSKLLGSLNDDELLASIPQLLEKKKSSEEKKLTPSIPVLNKYRIRITTPGKHRDNKITDAHEQTLNK